ncbi:hypothetical protein CsSME_00043458 [Camellia sinensis var. sinensis]
MAHKPFPAPPRQSTSVWCKTRHKTVESRDPEARRVAETFGNSRRTQTWMITKCSSGDVQVLRTVKNEVELCSPLIYSISKSNTESWPCHAPKICF